MLYPIELSVVPELRHAFLSKSEFLHSSLFTFFLLTWWFSFYFLLFFRSLCWGKLMKPHTSSSTVSLSHITRVPPLLPFPRLHAGLFFFFLFLVFVTVACICIKRLYSFILFIYIKMVIRTWQARILKRSLSLFLTFSLQFHYYCLFPIIIDGFTIFYTCLPSLFSPDLIYV